MNGQPDGFLLIFSGSIISGLPKLRMNQMGTDADKVKNRELFRFVIVEVSWRMTALFSTGRSCFRPK